MRTHGKDKSEGEGPNGRSGCMDLSPALCHAPASSRDTAGAVGWPLMPSVTSGSLRSVDTGCPRVGRNRQIHPAQPCLCSAQTGPAPTVWVPACEEGPEFTVVSPFAKIYRSSDDSGHCLSVISLCGPSPCQPPCAAPSFLRSKVFCL